MANTKISALTALTGADLANDDAFAVVDTSATATKRITFAELKLGILGAINNIGVPGAVGFGVGVCPALPTGYTALPGFAEVGNANYGNYQYSDGSICVWVPAFYTRLGHPDNPTYATYGVNSRSILPLSAYGGAAGAPAVLSYLNRAAHNSAKL